MNDAAVTAGINSATSCNASARIDWDEVGMVIFRNNLRFSIAVVVAVAVATVVVVVTSCDIFMVSLVVHTNSMLVVIPAADQLPPYDSF